MGSHLQHARYWSASWDTGIPTDSQILKKKKKPNIFLYQSLAQIQTGNWKSLSPPREKNLSPSVRHLFPFCDAGLSPGHSQVFHLSYLTPSGYPLVWVSLSSWFQSLLTSGSPIRKKENFPFVCYVFGVCFVHVCCIQHGFMFHLSTLWKKLHGYGKCCLSFQLCKGTQIGRSWSRSLQTYFKNNQLQKGLAEWLKW
jgi:hypothetical protein